MADLIDFLNFEARLCYKETLIMFGNADRALIFSQILWWHKNSPARCLLNVNGEVWLSKSYAEMALAFPHLGLRTIRRHVDKLVELKVIKQTSLGAGETGKKNSYAPNPQGLEDLYRQTLDPNFKPVHDEDSKPVQSLNRGNLASLSTSSTNEVELAKVMRSIWPDTLLYIRIYNIYMTYNLKSAQIKSNCYGDFDFEFWWKFYHLMFKGVVSSRKAESQKKWNRLTPDERTKVILYSSVEWFLKQAEYDCSGRDPAYKLASTFLNISVTNFKEGMEMFDDLEQLSADLTTKLVNLENTGLSRQRLLAWQAHAKINPNSQEAVNGIKHRGNNQENGYWGKKVRDNPLQLDTNSKLLTQ